MVEVMVALVIMSIGVLALAGLQLVTKRNTLDAAQRASASELASDLMERIRQNASDAALDIYVDAGSASGRVLGNGASLGGTVLNCRNVTCNPTQLAYFDLDQWQAHLDGAAASAGGGLINGRTCISEVLPATGAGRRIQVTVVWRSTVELPDNTAVTCLQGSSLYDASTPGDGLLRRTYVLDTYVTNRL